ncbi:acyl-CoA thioesterase/bile acid-CoA:amino acid N-acyltransferase family protein [Streptomyces sp. NBC_00690]|uniref:acyl-CoA thioesterase/bile acid-CoA:amino acid N-acyltransferase family protein n=1 Tax=Streptomyces sp. NBC_00690 TaxID=2975808 RepID=UPI002E2CA0CE|nr:acyl-CoA thioesterase/bile acid-CoA:amino acid N-acyltransferase family protein [Streptomyces sp. NBC_00690]
MSVAATGLALLLVAGCSGGNGGDKDGDEVRLRVDKTAALADEPVRIKVTGLEAGQEVTITSKAMDRDMSWTGRATFAADKAGTVDLARAQPRSGTYQKADGMGLFWSMKPDAGAADESWFSPPWPEAQPDYEVRLAVNVGGKQIANQTLTRTWMREGVTHRSLTTAKDKVDGSLYLPPAGSARRAPVLSFGGSEGGPGDKSTPALLASRGHPVLALCYFGCGVRPTTLERIELEYFVTAARLLKREGGAGSQRLAVIGTSRGSEAAQLLAHYYPDLFQDVVAYAPSHKTNPGFPKNVPAWTKDGKPVNHAPIPLQRVRGTVLAIAGGADGLWRSAPSADEIVKQKGASGSRHQALIYPQAGHGVSAPPYTALGRKFRHPLTGDTYDMGGTPAADAHARSDSWPKVLSLLQG